jgi:hypothetical protein
MIKIKTTTERLESKGGPVLAGKIAQMAGLTAVSSAVLACAGTIIASLYALLVQGDSAFEDASGLRENIFFLESLGLTRGRMQKKRYGFILRNSSPTRRR